MRHTPGPWHPGHLGSDSTCQCANVVDEVYPGGICSIHIDNGKRISEGGNGAPPRGQAIANMHVIAAGPGMLHALAALGFGSDRLDERIGWRGVIPAPSTNDHFRCEFCSEESINPTEIEHARECPVTIARAAMSKAKGARNE